MDLFLIYVQNFELIVRNLSKQYRPPRGVNVRVCSSLPRLSYLKASLFRLGDFDVKLGQVFNGTTVAAAIVEVEPQTARKIG